MILIKTCESCHEPITIIVSENEDYRTTKFYCSKCSVSGGIVKVNTYGAADASYTYLPDIDGFNSSTTTFDRKAVSEPVLSAEEKALEELKKFCVK